MAKHRPPIRYQSTVPGVISGVLHARNGKTPNSALDVVTNCLRLHFATPLPGLRHDTLLPAGAAPIHLDPRRLWRDVDAECYEDQRDLAIIMKIDYPPDEAPHVSYERVRAFAREYFARDHALPVSIAQHVPALSGSANAMHAHVIAGVRELTGYGFGGFSRLRFDAAQAEVQAAWAQHQKAWS